jgi:hypothetical protein
MRVYKPTAVGVNLLLDKYQCTRRYSLTGFKT